MITASVMKGLKELIILPPLQLRGNKSLLVRLYSLITRIEIWRQLLRHSAQYLANHFIFVYNFELAFVYPF